MAEGPEDLAALLRRALELLDEQGDHYAAIHVCQALELAKARASVDCDRVSSNG
jgi:hypothetical protein